MKKKKNVKLLIKMGYIISTCFETNLGGLPTWNYFLNT